MKLHIHCWHYPPEGQKRWKIRPRKRGCKKINPYIRGIATIPVLGLFGYGDNAYVWYAVELICCKCGKTKIRIHRDHNPQRVLGYPERGQLPPAKAGGLLPRFL